MPSFDPDDDTPGLEGDDEPDNGWTEERWNDGPARFTVTAPPEPELGTWAIVQPRGGRNGNVILRARLVITNVPEGTTSEGVLGWLDDEDPQFDYAVRADEWTANAQLTARNAPVVRWTGP